MSNLQMILKSEKKSKKAPNSTGWGPKKTATEPPKGRLCTIDGSSYVRLQFFQDGV